MSDINYDLIRTTEEEYGDEFKKHLFEQYKLYVEMADRISSRRMLANSFFVGINGALVTTFTVLVKEGVLQSNFIGVLPFIAAIILCFVWWRVVHSYKQLNTGKFKIIHEFEKKLPSSPYDAEWIALSRGQDKNVYLPLTHIENWVPIFFCIIYILLSINLFVI